MPTVRDLFFSLWLCLAVLLPVTVSFAQKEKKEKKNKREKVEKVTRVKKENDLRVQDFKPTQSKGVVQTPRINFPNINSIRYYNQPAKLAAINRHERNKEWKEMFAALYDYVSKFGIDNFVKDMGLLWKLARLSESLGYMKLTKDLYRLIIKHYRGDLQQALYQYEKHFKLEKDLYVELEYYYKLVERRKAIDTLKPPQDIMLEMGDEINSPFEDYGLTITGQDDNFIYFTSKRNSRDTSRITKDIMGARLDEDIYYSEKDQDGFWGEAKKVEGNINSQFNEGSPCVSRDGNTIVFVRCHAPDSYGDCDLFYSEKDTAGNWLQVKNIGPSVNSYSWDSHPAFSITGDTLYFASDRKGGFGGTDIYFSVRNAGKKGKGGTWSKAKNLGPIVNTRGSEVSPYLHPKYNVLYFSSNVQLLNFGGFDIYKSFISNGILTEPKNVGPLVNGKGDEFYFTIDSRSRWLFYAKSEPSDPQNLDLNSFPLPMEAKPNNTVRFSGVVKDEFTGEVFKGVVSIIDLSERTEVAPKYLRDDGSFEFELINQRNYLLLIEGDNFFNIREVFYLEGDTEVNIPAVSLNSKITFKSIDFAPGSDKILPEAENNLHLVINFLNKNPQYNVKVIGHTDSDGDADMNMQLSQNRANSIRRFIVEYGHLGENRVTAMGKGNTDPLVANEETEEDKKLNRRVEFKIYLAVLGDEGGTSTDDDAPEEGSWDDAADDGGEW